MASLADLFNPTFLMFLGILVLVVALLVVYFESKMRDQNHKIASMLSLVSTLAEDMNGVKMGLNHLAIRQQPTVPVGDNLGNLQKMNLIEVSDDEESEDETSNDDESINEDSVDDESNNDDLESVEDDLAIIEDGSECDNDDIKIVKLQVSNEDVDEDNDSYEEAHNLEFDAVEDLADLDGDLVPEVNNEYVEEVLDLKYDDDEAKQLDESNIISSSDLRTISINLGEEHQHNEENIDYKKLQLPKLRSIAVEKGLTSNSEASKLKKPELLKLLGAE